MRINPGDLVHRVGGRGYYGPEVCVVECAGLLCLLDDGDIVESWDLMRASEIRRLRKIYPEHRRLREGACTWRGTDRSMRGLIKWTVGMENGGKAIR